VPEYTYQPMQGQQDAQQVDMPRVGAGRSMYTSGPLPELEGFEALRQVVEGNPDDIGAHMALAAGYSQLGDLNTTLRVYRRVLRKRNIPAMFLSLIAEELNDYESDMEGDAHYHQTRGDLYMKQGRHQEAILEYNKIK
jgi:tetratricopeptide (TPR) repeat protein